MIYFIDGKSELAKVWEIEFEPVNDAGGDAGPMGGLGGAGGGMPPRPPGGGFPGLPGLPGKGPGVLPPGFEKFLKK